MLLVNSGSLCFACVAVVGLSACNQDGAVPTERNGAAGATSAPGGSAGSESSSSGSGSGSASGGSPAAAGASPGAAGASGWSPGETAWAPFPWAPEGCKGAQYAIEPSEAAPTLSWIPCENGNSGCTRLVTDWDRSVPQRARFSPYHFHSSPKDSEPFLWAARVQTDEDLEVVYRDNSPVLVIRSSDTYCKPGRTQPTSAGACTVFPQPEGNHVALIDWDDPSSVVSLAESQASYSRGCTSEHRLASTTGPYLFMLSLSSGVETPIRWEDGLFMTAQMYDDRALIVRGADAGKQDAWHWNDESGLQRLSIDGNVWALTFDGHDIAWLEVEPEEGNTLPEGKPGVLWTSPAPGFGEWNPRRVTDVAPTVFGMGGQVSGNGIFALVEDKPGVYDRRVHVYRLSDGRHWELPNLPDLVRTDDLEKSTVPINILRVTDTEIWWVGMSESVKQVTTVVRQRLDTL
jgi:hypothetical protein